MAYVYREKNAAGKPNFCSCSNVPTKAFCQSDFCAELDSNGAIIYRGDPAYSTYPPLRNEGGYDNANGLGVYDNQNKSIGHRAPCNLQLEIYNSTSQYYCTDCEDLNGIYDAVHIQGYNGIDGDGSMWHWPLCNPDRIGNACGASFAYGYLGFDANDGFNPAVDSGRNVYLNIKIANQLIDYRPTGTPINRLCTNNTLPLNTYSDSLSGCATYLNYNTINDAGLAHKRILVGEMKYKNGGYYDSSVDCTSFSNLEVSEDIRVRGLCALDFKVTSLNDDDLKGFKRSVAYQWGGSVMSFGGAGYPFYDAGAGLRYNLCTDQTGYGAWNYPPSYYDLDLPTLTTEYDSYWHITRVYEKPPVLWDVTIANAEGRASGLNGEHFLFPYRADFETISVGLGTTTSYTNRTVKEFYDYDSKIATEDLYGNYNKVGCDNTCTYDNFCINKMELDIGDSNDERLNPVLSLTGSITSNGYTYTNVYIAYSGSVAQGTNKGWLNSPLTLNFGVGYYNSPATPINNIYNLENLNITINNSNLYSEVDQMNCFPVPRNPNIKGGKEPDAFLVEFTDDWLPGYMKVQKPVFYSATQYPQEARDAYPEPEVWAFSFCQESTEAGSCITNKIIDDCYSCSECTTNCENSDWSGPVGAFILTRDFDYQVSESVSPFCFENSTCNNIKDLGSDPFSTNQGYSVPTVIRYAHRNSNPVTICNWGQISLEIIRGSNLLPCGESYNMEPDINISNANRNRIRINMAIHWPQKNENEPDVTPFCQDLMFHPNADGCGPQCTPGTSAPPHEPCITDDFIDCFIHDATPCRSPCQYDGSEFVTSGERWSKRFFYTDLPLVEFENIKYVEFDDVNGHDLTYYDGNEYYTSDNVAPNYRCYFSQCQDETEWVWNSEFLSLEQIEVPLENRIYHGKWGGGTVKVTPIFY